MIQESIQDFSADQFWLIITNGQRGAVLSHSKIDLFCK